MKRTKHHTFKPLFPKENAYPMYAGNKNQELVQKKQIIRVLDPEINKSSIATSVLKTATRTTKLYEFAIIHGLNISYVVISWTLPNVPVKTILLQAA